MNFWIEHTESEVNESERRASAIPRLAQAKVWFGTKFEASKYARASVEDIRHLAEEFEESEIFARKSVKQANPNGLDFGLFDPYNPSKYMKGNWFLSLGGGLLPNLFNCSTSIYTDINIHCYLRAISI